jgi:hypothetical protein
MDYLSGRKQFVSYHGAFSDVTGVPSGVIQGSSIGPCVFTIFINDLCQVIKHAKPSLFADDFKMVGDVSTLTDREFMQSDVRELAAWSAANKLPINIAKSSVLHYGNGNVHEVYTINGETIACVESCKDLGVLRCDSFCYDTHARNVAQKAAKLAGMVLKIFSTREPKFLRQLFVSYVRPTLEYATQVWSPSASAVSELIERVQRRYTKRIKGFENLPYVQRLEKLKLDSLAHRRFYHDVLLAYKCLYGYIASRPSSLGLQVSQASTRRGGLRFDHRKPKTSVIAAGFSYRVPIEWDKLPSNCVANNAISTFKSACKRFFKHHS